MIPIQSISNILKTMSLADFPPWVYISVRRWPIDSPHKGPVTRKKFPFDEVIMLFYGCECSQTRYAIAVFVFWEIYVFCGPLKSRPSRAGNPMANNVERFFTAWLHQYISVPWFIHGNDTNHTKCNMSSVTYVAVKYDVFIFCSKTQIEISLEISKLNRWHHLYDYE